MKFYLDTEFIEKRGSISIISIGIVSENGTSLYIENSNMSPEVFKDAWLMKNVVPSLCFDPSIDRGTTRLLSSPDIDVDCFKIICPYDDIQKHVSTWVYGQTRIQKETIEFRAYYADYDWVVFCWLFGKMIDLPKDFPMYCYDLKQEMDRLFLDSQWKEVNVPEPIGEHNALIDALWNKKLDEELMCHRNYMV